MPEHDTNSGAPNLVAGSMFAACLLEEVTERGRVRVVWKAT